jgi:hypothetical protein
MFNIILTVEKGPTLSARDRPGKAGRSQLLSGCPSLHVLLDAGQGIVGHLLYI